MTESIEGAPLAGPFAEQIKREAEALARRPGLAVITVGDGSASLAYAENRRRDCVECGFYSEEYALPEDLSQDDLLQLIDILNRRGDIDGILCRVPLPDGLDEKAVLTAVVPEKNIGGGQDRMTRVMLMKHTLAAAKARQRA